MAISLGSVGSAAFGANGFAVSLPSSSAGAMLLLLAGVKPFNGGWSVSGWNALGSFTSGSTAAGTDAGSMKVQAWWKEHSGSESDPTLTEGSPAWNVAGAFIHAWQKEAGEVWETPVMVGGGDSTGPDISITCDADPGLTAGDAACAWIATPSDADAPLATAVAWTATGVTPTHQTMHATDPETTTGGDMALVGRRTSSMTGTASAAPVITATLAAAHEAAGALIRLRVTAAPVEDPYPYIGGGFYGWTPMADKDWPPTYTPREDRGITLMEKKLWLPEAA